MINAVRTIMTEHEPLYIYKAVTTHSHNANLEAMVLVIINSHIGEAELKGAVSNR